MAESTETGNDLAAMRRHNLQRIAEAIRDHPGISQGDLVTQSGLAAGAVSSLVNSLVEAEILTEAADRAASGRGRPRRLFALSDTWADVIGVQVSRSGVEVRSATLGGRIVSQATRMFNGVPTAAEAGVTLAALLSDAPSRLRRPEHPAPRLVISIPGVHRHGYLSAEELDWLDVPEQVVLDPIRKAGFSRIAVANDGTLATLAEWRVGAATGNDNAAVILLERGLGGNAAIDGRIVKGHGEAPGFGHTPVDPSGDRCICGLRGCIELSVSLGRFALKLDETDRLEARSPADYAADLARRAEASDPNVLTLLDEGKRRLREFSDLAVSLLSPDVIVLTGSGSPLAPWLLSERAGSSGIPMVRGSLGADAPIVGATLAAQDAYLADPLSAGL